MRPLSIRAAPDCPDFLIPEILPFSLELGHTETTWCRLRTSRVGMHSQLSDLPIVFAEVSLTAGSVAILRELSLTIAPGPPTVLLGPNGSGKSSVLHLAMGLVRPSNGTISWGGHPIEEARRLAIVFQRPVMLRRSVAANVLYALRASGNAAHAAQKVETVLRRVGLAGFEERPARRLSGGEQQRLALARALATDPQVLFLDEPTASLDPAATKGVEEIVQSIARSGVKIVMATHDLGQARRLAGDIVLLVRGRVMEHAPAATLFANPQSREAAAFLRGDLVL
jgi:tungstate transport system ATP-binding protein